MKNVSVVGDRPVIHRECGGSGVRGLIYGRLYLPVFGLWIDHGACWRGFHSTGVGPVPPSPWVYLPIALYLTTTHGLLTRWALTQRPDRFVETEFL